MKKTVVLLLALIVLFSLCSCDDASIKITTPEEELDFGAQVEQLLNSGNNKADISKGSGLLAAAKSTENDQYGYVDELGNWMVQPSYSDAKECTNGYGIVLDSSGQYSYIDKSGNGIFSWLDGYRVAESNHFSDGMLVVALSSSFSQKYSYVNESFQKVITAVNLPYVAWRYYYNTNMFSFASRFNNGLAVVMRYKNSELYDGLDWESAYVIDKSGSIVATLPAGLDPGVGGIDDNGNIIVSNRENKFGLCDTKGNLIIECKYRFLKHCEDSLYLACDDTGFYGFIDSQGNVVIDFKYQKALPFSGGLAAVNMDGSWGFINETGAVVIDYMFSDVAAIYNDNQDDSLNRAAFSDGLAAVKYGDTWVIINSECKPIHAIGANEWSEDYCPYSAIANGYICFAKTANDKVLYGSANYNGEQVITPQFAYLGSFN